MDELTLFGVNKVIHDDPDWLWFLDRDNYLPYLEKFALEEGTYLELWDEIFQVFPLKWAKQVYVNNHNGVAWTGLHPPVNGWLQQHPVVCFLALKPYGWLTVAPLIRLGLDLLRTKNLPRIQTIRRDLRNFNQYIGRLFELEILSEFARREWQPEVVGTPDFRFSVKGLRVYGEARHRGAPFGMAVSSLVFPPDGDWHCLQIYLKRLSGIRVEATTIAKNINQGIKELLSRTDSAMATSVETSDYRMTHSKQGEPRTIVISYGKSDRYADELETLIYSTLSEKSKQLRGVSEDGYPTVLLIDCRSLVRPKSSTATEAQGRNFLKYRDRILDGGFKFISDNPWVSGIIWWWRSAEWPLNLANIVHQPIPISITVGNQYFDEFDDTDFVDQLQNQLLRQS